MRHTLDIALARQPIFDRTDHVIGYELLYRRTARDTAALPPDDPGASQMTTDTIAGTFLGMGLERVTGGKRAFVNVDRWMLLDGSVRVLEPDQVVLEILESVACDPETLAACAALVGEGYVIALDDFEYSESYEPLLRLARIVKLDVLGKSEAALANVLERLRPFGVRCLAERVESSTTRMMCVRLGFDLFQGYYFAHPETLSGREIPVEQAHIIRLLNLLRDPTQSDVVLEDIFRRDLSLTYKLLRIVNSASTGHVGVTSIGHGLRLLGRGSLHRWMALLLVSSMATRSPVHDELVEMAMIRARFCELITETFGQRRDGGASFVAGLFSLLDALMEVSMSDLVAKLDLTPELKQVLVEREGPFAPALRVVEAYESARWTEVFSTIALGDRVIETLPELYLRAVEWAHENGPPRRASEGFAL
jgi:EAL and modified HD-GYP domain-containing signal transduction protein